MVEVEMGNNPQFGNSMGSGLLPVKKHRIHALFPVTYKGTAEKEVPANFLDFWSLEGNLDEIEGKLKEIKELEETKVNLLKELKIKEKEDKDLGVLKELKETELIKLAELIEELKNKPSSPESEEVQKLKEELNRLKESLKNNALQQSKETELEKSIDSKNNELKELEESIESKNNVLKYLKELKELKDKSSSPESEEVEKLKIELKKLNTELENNPSSSGEELRVKKNKELKDKSLSPMYQELRAELKELKKLKELKDKTLKELNGLKNKAPSPDLEELKAELKNKPSSPDLEELIKLRESIDLKIKELIDRSLSPEFRELITEFGKLSESKDKELKELKELKNKAEEDLKELKNKISSPDLEKLETDLKKLKEELNRLKGLKGLKGLEVDTVLSDIGFKDLIKCTDNNPAVWQLQDKGEGLSLGDFYPYIRQIIGGDESNQLKLCTFFRLATPQILSQVKGGKKRLFTLDLKSGSAAQRRCGVNALGFQFDNARVFVFRSGIVILDLSWHYEKQNNVEENNAEESDEDKKRLKVNAVLEGNYLLSHDNHRSKHGKDQTSINDEESHGMTAQRLRDIAEALLPKIGDFVPEIHADRRILYSLVEISKEVKAEQLSQISIWLSHRNTSDYMPSKNIVEHDLLQPFPYLCHAASIEGGASVICQASMESEYIEHFISGSASKAYLPLFIASLHSHFWLLNQTQWIPAGRSKSNSREESEGMDSVFEDTVGFRRNFHFPLVSQISLYNRFHAHWQEALKIPERIRFQEQTARDVSELLKTRRTRWIGRFSGAVGGFLITHEVMEIVSKNGFIGAVPDMRVWLVDVAFKSHDEIEHMVSLVENWEYAIFVGSLVGAAFGFLLSFWFDKVVKKE
jgi:hypothetical protein